MTSTVGRVRELALAHEDLSAKVPNSLLFVGPAGIGKSTVLAAAAASAPSWGFDVRRSCASASERDLPYVGLHDLLGGALDAPADLPAPLCRALEVVLLRADPPEGGLDVLAVDVAVLKVFEDLGSRRRLMLVLDDVQWMDRSTRRVLGFVLRRLHPGRVTVVAASREVGPVTDELMPVDPLLIEVGPLTQPEIADLVELHTGHVLSPQRVQELSRLSGGNPFLALELARAGSSTVHGLEQFPVPQRHLQVLGPRLAALSSDARRAVLGAALASRATTELLARVAGAVGLASAESARVLHVVGSSIEFDHPLLAAAARHDAGVVAEREMHLALASASDDVLERARHLALGTVGEDGALANELEAAAGLAADRAAIALAAQLSRSSLERTPADSLTDRVRRAVAAARWFSQCGEGDDARAVLASALEVLPVGRLRAQCLIGLADAMGQDIAGALTLLHEAIAQPGLGPDVSLAARLQLAGSLFVSGDVEGARGEAARAGTAARDAGASEMATALDMEEAVADWCLGMPLELSAAWKRIRPPSSRAPAYSHPDRLLAHAALGRDDTQTARQLLEGLVRLSRERGDLESEGGLSMHLAEVAIRDGRLSDAAAWAERAWHRLRDHPTLYVRAHIAAWTGELDTARRLAGASLETAVAVHDALFEAQSLLVLGFVEVSANRFPQASEYEVRLRDLVARTKWGHPGLPRWQGDAVEAFLGAGRAREAAEVTALLWSQASHLELRGCRGLAAHCDGLIHAHAGDLKLADDNLTLALSLMEDLDMPLDRARTLLALGAVRRRLRQRATARDVLTEAHAIFSRAGAKLWAERAEVELRRASSGRAGEQLSAGERSVAELAAAGLTNREIAAQLYLSPKTVETVLTHIYRKLGVRSRTELSRSLTDA